MDIVLGVRIEMVEAVLGSPPEHALLGRALRHEGQDELKGPTGGKGAVGKIAVIAGADREHPDPIESHPDSDGLPGHARPDGREAGEMDEKERDGLRIDDVIVIIVIFGAAGIRQPLGLGY